jgi:hypothetical protein
MKNTKILNWFKYTPILLLFIFGSCDNNDYSNYKYEKPYIIYHKSYLCKELFTYAYFDKNGMKNYFTDNNKYSIGDTIK